jgi:hypothetical protein
MQASGRHRYVTQVSDLGKCVPQTNAERQSAYRRRHCTELAKLRAALGDAQAVITAQAAGIALLKQERERLYGMLEAASVSSSGAGPQTPDCPHPAHLVDGDRCTGCGQVVDSW